MKSNSDPQSIRLWRIKDEENIKKVFLNLHEKIRRFTSFDYKIKSPLILIERNDNNTADELNLVEGSNLYIEVSKSTGWYFKLEGDPDEDQCEFCRSYRILKFECRCKKVKYCTEVCKVKDIDYYARVCELAGEEDQNDEPFRFQSQSCKGQCGLQNLGNTCFMNSALQCMSNTIPLTKYFLKKAYEQEINEQNPLGTKGKLAKSYGKFLKNVWVESSSVFSPFALKMAVANVQSMFSGYQQHDSQEFLSYILDGLHEDLNRVKVKKYTESIDSNGRPDEVVSKESWLNHIKRNQSIIVDLMQGQFKSKVTCPDCSKESITFDPFLTCSLPIPNIEYKTMNMYLIFANNKRISVEAKYSYDTSSNQTVKDLKDYISQKYEVQASHLNFFCLNYDNIKEFFPDETPLEKVRKGGKEFYKNVLMLEYEVETSNQDYMIVPIEFKTMQEQKYMSRKLARMPFTFIRPFLIKKNASKKDIHLALFQYLKPIFDRGISPESEYSQDSQSMPIDKLYEKYVLKDTPPYKLFVDTDCQDYMQKPCSWCKEENCKNCPLPYIEDEEGLYEFTQKSKSYHQFRFECFVDQSTELGKYTCNLNNLDSNNQNNNDNHKQNDNKTDIYDCLKLFEQPERLGEDNEWYCSNCQKHQKALKQIVIYRAPEILILHLKRFKGSGGLFKSKLTKIVDFPHALDMTEYVLKKETPQYYYDEDEEYFKENYIHPVVIPAEQSEHIDQELQDTKVNQSPINNNKLEEEQKNDNMEIENEQANKDKLFYDLYAITNHYGNLGFGHYTAYACNNNKWFCFDDSSVRSVSEDQLVSEASYILFYKRRK